MADEPERHADSPETGLFGRLPSARPGVRSPRRKAEPPQERPAPAPAAPEVASKQAGEAAGASASQRREPATASRRVRPPDTSGPSSHSPPPTRPKAAEEPTASHGDEPPAAPEAAPGESPGVEDLAWAGITVAAEAATLGVRLLNRALGAVRKPTDPR